MKIYYSSERNGFFDNVLRPQYEESKDGWPKDAIEISQELYDEMFEGQRKGLSITPGGNGLPTLVRVSPPSPSSESMRAGMIAEADAVIQPLMGYALAGIMSDADKTRFKAWNEYRKALEDIDVTATNIEWPIKPE